MILKEILIRNAKPKDKVYRLFDGKGLYLEILPAGGKYWRVKYRFAGKEKRLAIGVYPEISLTEARDECYQARRLLREGIDPFQNKRDKKLKHLVETNNSFESVAREWHEHRKLSWTPRHAGFTLRRLEADIFPTLGYKITAPELLFTIRNIEARGALDISRRLLQTCGQIFRYGIATGRTDRDIAADLRGALKTRKSVNMASLEAKELPEFFQRLESYDGDLQTRLALRFLVLTFVRSTELRAAKWDEINFGAAEWRIPAERMKMREQHIVPLATQTLEVLKQLKEVSGFREHVFPNRNKPNIYISENTLLYALYRMGYHKRATTHGFRSTASTILNEHGFRADVIERQLAHGERNKVRASYNHAQYLAERRQMMQWWADYLDRVAGSNADINRLKEVVS